MFRNVVLGLIAMGLASLAQGQELNARVTVVANRVNNQVNKNTFTTLQGALTNFLNTRKWTTDVFAQNEKIECNFLLNLESTDEPNIYTGFLTVQAARPVFNSSYASPIVNFKDESIAFKYIEFQQLDFNENRVSGTQPLVSNLTAVFAYYANMILGFDYDSFQQKTGTPFFIKAQNIVNNAPDGRGIAGWKAFEGLRNRYWLVENMLNTRYDQMHAVYYNYYRLGMDKMYDDINASRTNILSVLTDLEKFNQDNPNTMINQFFFQGKGNEIAALFSQALPADKSRALEILPKIDITNAGLYREKLK